MPRALVALGANLGQRQATLAQALDRLAQHAAVGTFRVSQIHETQPAGGPAGQGGFLNAAASFETSLAPEALHTELHSIETELGRQRGERWSARVIDLDLLLYDERIVVTPALQVPHPRMSFRRFVLEPAFEVAPDMTHPLVGWTVARLLDHLNHAPPYVALVGSPESRPEELAASAAARVGATYLAKPVVTSQDASGGDPSGPTQAASIQFLDRAVRLLAACNWSSGQPVISGFYVEECLADARAKLDDAADARIEVAWRRQQDSLVRPKLLVVLDAWEALVAARINAQGLSHQSPQDAWLRLAARGGQPVMCAGRSSFEEQLSEITAALTAMR